MNMENSGVGFFGKLPTLGDFVSRRLSREFIDPWDKWLQSSMRASQDIHGDDWLSLFLVSPLWRFALSPGVCGSTAWAGVIMPSVDRVGRYYPLTLARAIDAAQIIEIFLPGCPWFKELESAALSVLDEPFDLESFDQTLLNIPPPQRSSLQCRDFYREHRPSANKTAFRCELQSISQSDQLFPGLTQSLLKHFLHSYSLWAMEDIQQGNAQFLCFEGMPPIDAYADFLTGMPLSPNKPPPAPPISAASPNTQEGNEPTHPNGKTSHTNVSSGHWHSHGITEVGNRRRHNEDAMLNAPGLGLWVVADGMGGHQSGDMASQRIVSTLAAMPSDIELLKQEEWFSQCLQQINQDLCHIAEKMHMGAVVGSTVVALLAKGKQCAAIWAGDSRLYQLRAGQFKQLTHDHTLLDEVLRSGSMDREQAMQQVGANVITRAVGGQETLELDAIHFEAKPGDRYLLCSDGLDKELTESEIAEKLKVDDYKAAAENLMNTALSRAAIDNITVIVIDYRNDE